MIFSDGAALEPEPRGGVVERAAAVAVATGAPTSSIAAKRQVVPERAAADGGDCLEHCGEGAAPAVATVAVPSPAASGLVVCQQAAANRDDAWREDVAGIQFEIAQCVEDGAAGPKIGRH